MNMKQRSFLIILLAAPLLWVLMSTSAIVQSDDSGLHPGGQTLGGPGFFKEEDTGPQEIYNADIPSAVCLTMIGKSGTTVATFDSGVPD